MTSNILTGMLLAPYTVIEDDVSQVRLLVRYLTITGK